MPDGTLRHTLALQNPEYASTFSKVLETALQVWHEPRLPDFTSHGKPHIEQVETNLDALACPIMHLASALTPEELLVLLSACCLHDIGMQLDEADAREKHADYTYEMILQSSPWTLSDKRTVTLTAIEDSNLREAVALVARAHWTDYALNLPEEEVLVGNKRGRLRLLGLLLANADLLDLNPSRAGYFSSPHRLSNPDGQTRLHQVKHAWIRNFVIEQHNDGDFHFILRWKPDTDVARSMSDWVMGPTNRELQWIAPALKIVSSGAIRWATRWAEVHFGQSVSPLEELGLPATHVMRTELAEQNRIDRDAFSNAFRNALTTQGPSLFHIQRDSRFDGEKILEWCEAHALALKECQLASLTILPWQNKTLADAVSEVLECIGHHLEESDEVGALSKLAEVVTDMVDPLVIVIRSGHSEETILHQILQAALQPADKPRVCLLVSDPHLNLADLPAASTHRFPLTAFAEDDIRQCVARRLGYDDVRCGQVWRTVEITEAQNMPAKVYALMDTEYRNAVDCH